jgi:SAM-dependent methyltransferase
MGKAIAVRGLLAQRRYFDLGKDYWWLRGKYILLREVVEARLALSRREPGRGLRILDIGCGPGNLLDTWSTLGETFGSDVSSDALVFARGRGYARLFHADLTRFPVRAAAFDLISMVDVLEHIEDDRAALAEAVRVLRPGGMMILSVPAFQVLWGDHDTRYGHFRRYTAGQLRAMLRGAGLRVVKLTYFQSLYFLPLLVFRRLQRLLGPSKDGDDFVPVPRWLNTLLTWTLVAEGRLAQRVDLPIGVTLLALVIKEGD